MKASVAFLLVIVLLAVILEFVEGESEEQDPGWWGRKRRRRRQYRCRPQNCRLDQWCSWSSCHYGVQTRTRHIISPARCGGRCNWGLKQSRHCPVNGGWTAWGQWSCSTTCGEGKRSRHRTCTNPRPAYGGRRCTGNIGEYSSCKPFNKPCPVNGGWSKWKAWSSCSKSCGTGTRTRARTCTSPQPAHGGRVCPGNQKQIETCKVASCKTPPYTHKGCFEDKPNRAMPDQIHLKSGNNNPVKRCAEAVRSKDDRYKCFGVQNGGECWSGLQALDPNKGYAKYGQCSRCKNGVGGSWANDVYCFKSAAPPPKPTEVPITKPRTRPPTKPPGPVPTTGSPDSCYSPWSEWSGCSVGCGCGKDFRVRFCKCDICTGLTNESRPCNCHQCPGQG